MQKVGTALIAAVVLAAFASTAGASIVSENGSRDTSGFEAAGPVYAEGSSGAGKYVWFVDHRAGEDILRGFDQTNPLSALVLGSIDGTAGVGPGEIGEVGGIAFNPNQNLLYVTDRTNNRLIIYPRSNSGGPSDPVDYAGAFAISSFGGGGGFSFTDPRGVAYDPINGWGYMTLTDDSGHHGFIRFSGMPIGNSLNWLMFVWDPSGGSPSALAVDQNNGSVYMAVDDRHRVRGLNSAMDAVVGEFNSPDSVDYTSVHLDSAGNRLFAVNADAIDVFSLKTARLLGSVTGISFDSSNVALSGLANTQQFFLASAAAPLARNLLATTAPTCTPAPTVVIPSGASYSFTPACTDPDGSTVKELEISSAPAIGTATVGGNYDQIDFSTTTGVTGGADIGYRMTTQDGRSVEYHQVINVGPPDTEAPTVQITAPADGATLTSSPVTLNYTVSDNYDTAPQCNLAQGAQISLDPGPNTINVSCEDDVGNAAADSVVVNYDPPDTTPPTVTITSPIDGSYTNSSPAQVNFTSSDDVDTNLDCTQTSGDEVSLTPGANTISVSCEDDAGNIGSDSVTVTYDTEPPTVAITSPADGSTTTDSAVYIDFSASDNEDGGISCDHDSETSYIGLNAGPNTITVSCTDAAGNVGSDSITVTYDSDAPSVSITAPSNGSYTNSSPVAVTFTASDDLDTDLSCTRTSGDEVSLTPGANTISVSCEDDAGNADSDSVTVTYDTEPPEVSITSPADGTTTADSSVHIDFTASDNEDGGVSCDHDSETSDISLDPGPNTITVSCSDAAGNVGSDSITVVSDTESPTVTITSPDDGSYTNQSPVAVDYTASDNIDTSLDCTQASGDSVTLTAGENTIAVVCEDDAGNAGTSIVSVTYDTVPPTVAITDPADGEIRTEPFVYVDFTTDDNEGGWINCDYDSESPGIELTPGPNTIVISCTDAAGNSGSDSVTVTYYAEGPTVSINMPAPGATLETNPATVHYTVNDPVDPAPTCSIADGAAVQLLEGSNTITVSCTNQAGLSGSDSVTVTYAPPKTSEPTEPVIRKSANLEPTAGKVLVKLPGSDEFIPLEEALLVPVGTIIDARGGTAHLTLANQNGSTYEAYFWAGVFKVTQGGGDQPIATMKILDEEGYNPRLAAAAAYPRLERDPFEAIRIAKRGKKKGGLWGNGKGNFRTSGSGGAATVRGTKWYVANYENGTYFSVARGVVNVKPVHGNCFDLKAGESRFVEYRPLTDSQRKKKMPSGLPKRKKKGCI